MKERLIIKHFGPVKDLNIELKRFNFFIGTQGSGKSTISKVLTICRDMKWYIQILEGNDVTEPFRHFDIDEYFQDDSYILYYNPYNETEIIYENKVFSIKYKDSTKEDTKDYFEQQLAISRLTFSMSQPGDGSVIDYKAQEANSRCILYIPAERNLIGNLSSALASIMLAKIPISDTIIEYMSLFEKSKKEFPKYEIPFLGVSYQKKEGKERIIINSNGKELPMNACSSGLQSVLPMIMVIDYAIKVECFDSFVIEEPEQNLFPENQRQLLSFITSRNIDKLETPQFFITTHSPYLLSSLNNLMLAYKLYMIDSVRDEVGKIINPECMIDPDSVAVYGLSTKDNKEYCKNLIDNKTGIISVNALDTASEYIGEDFDRLYQLYIKTKKGN